MRKPYLALATLIAAVSLTGCYKTIGPVVTSVRLDKSGTLHFTRCNLVVGSTWLWVPDGDLENCVTESHESVEAPTPTPERSSGKTSKD
jgi:hypothetical protein